MKKRMRILTFLLAGAVAFGTAATPLTAMAASGTYSITQPGKVNAGENVAYKISGVTKKQYAVVRVRGAAKTEVTVKKGSKNITSAVRSKSGYKMNGTGSTLTVKVNAKQSAVNKKYKVNVKIYNASNKKLVKKVSATSTVLVAATAISIDSTSLSLKAGESKTLSYTLTPSVSTDDVKYTSSDKSVAEVDEKTGKVTAIKEGAATIVATTTSGQKATCTVQVTAVQTPDEPTQPDDPVVVAGEAANVSATLENPLADYENTVLNTTSAEVNVKVTDKDGNPVANQNVLLEKGINWNNVLSYVNSGSDGVMTMTNQKGIATFVMRAYDKDYTGLADYKIKVVGTDVETEGIVKFAKIEIDTVEVPGETDEAGNKTANFGKFAIATNAKQDWNIDKIDGEREGVRDTHTLEETLSEYIASQQVSAKGTDEHALTLNAVPMILIPNAVNSDQYQTQVQTVPEETGASGKYGTYKETDNEWIIELEKDSAGLESAYITFDSIKVSEKATLKMEYFSSYRDGKVSGKVGDTVEIANGSQSVYVQNRAYQIPITDEGVKAVRLTLKSAGQIDTAYEDGFKVKDITYTYKERGAMGTWEPLKGASITWEAVTPVYTPDTRLSSAQKRSLGLSGSNTFMYKMPVYPFTGNAVISEFDGNNNLVAYYLAPTTNERKSSGLGYKNVNILSASQSNAPEDEAYRVTPEEANTVLTTGYTVSDDGKTIVVNSEKTGSLNLKGTVSVKDMGKDELNGRNNTLYTSVQFNPLPENSVANQDAFLALPGQSIKVTAQLVDKNGNKQSVNGQGIKLTLKENHGSVVVTGVDQAGDNKTFTGNTDADGQVHMTLTAAQVTELIGLSGEATGNGKQYSVQLNIGGKNVEEADLYWASANLYFKSDVKDTTNPVVTTDANPTAEITGIAPYVTSSWKYGVLANATNYKTKQESNDGKDYGRLADYDEIRIEGLKIKMTPDGKNKGKYEDSANGEVIATSQKAGTDKVVATIDSSSVSGDVTFKAIKSLPDGSEEVTTYTCVGEGTPILKAQMTMNIGWQAKTDSVLSWFSPLAGTNGSMASGTKTLYVKLTDSTGENPKTGTVTITAGDDAVLVGNDVVAYQNLSSYRSAKSNYETTGAATYAGAVTTFEDAVADLEDKAETDLSADNDAYKKAKAALDQAVMTYENAISTYAQAIVSAKGDATAKATAKTEYDKKQAEFLNAVNTFNTAINTALTDAGVSPSNYTTAAFEEFMKATTADGTVTLDPGNDSTVKTFVTAANAYITSATTYSDAIKDWSVSGANTKDVTVTNGYAVVQVEVNPNLIQPSTILTAKYGDDQSENIIINWKDGAPLAAVQDKDTNTAAVKLNSATSITITFNNNLDAASLKKEMFTVTSNGTETAIQDVTVKENELTIDLKIALTSQQNIGVTVKPYTDDKTGIKYMLTDENGYSITGDPMTLVNNGTAK